MSGPAAHLLCLLLVVLDFVARTVRTQLFLRGLGFQRSFRDVLVQSALGETASSLTPLRAGGEPARVWLMRHQGIPAGVGVVAVGIELLATSVIILLVAVGLGFTIGGEWWETAGPSLISSATRSWPWLAAILVATLVAWTLVERFRPDLTHGAGAELKTARRHLRDLPMWVYLVTAPITVVNIGARVAILPVLALTLPHPPPLAATIVGSFALLYAQAIIPTPAGAGAVELGFLGGAAGSMGVEEARLLLQWRLYTTIVGTVLGVVLTVAKFHTNIFPFVLRQPAGARVDIPVAGDPLGPPVAEERQVVRRPPQRAPGREDAS